MSGPRHMRTGAPVVLDPDSKTTPATLALMRRAEERAAELLRSRGWMVVAPEDVKRHRESKLVDVPLPLEEA